MSAEVQPGVAKSRAAHRFSSTFDDEGSQSPGIHELERSLESTDIAPVEAGCSSFQQLKYVQMYKLSVSVLQSVHGDQLCLATTCRNIWRVEISFESDSGTQICKPLPVGW